MHICRSSWVLAMALWLASPQPCVWAEGSGTLQPSARMQVAGQVGPKGYGQFSGAGWPSAMQASNEEAGLNWGAVFARETIMGLALTGSGAFFIKKGFDYRREADALYDRYLDALDPTEITLLYQRTNKRDLKSKLSWTLGAVLAAGGIHILFGHQLAALHLELAPFFLGTHPLTGNHGAQVTLSRNF